MEMRLLQIKVSCFKLNVICIYTYSLFCRRVEEIEKTKAPQILKIDYDEASGVSSDADSDDLSGAEEESVGRMEPTDGYTGASDADKFFTRHIPPTRTGEHPLLTNTGRRCMYNKIYVSEHRL